MSSQNLKKVKFKSDILKRNIKQKVFILGAMKELGTQSDFFHIKDFPF